MLLIIEMSDATYDYDTGEQLDLYAECGIKDYWVVNVEHYRLEVFRKPRRGVYTSREEIDYESSISPLALPRIRLEVEQAFSRK